ncbi:hypothetical protein DRE_07586 [Drechslerella stenobrocha 248]|uniref:MAGE domain-containing protein n=1 Tax=Drechslerella stenobrocha 248 TaxID=1043628 RepID=W7I3Y6_9PEZI|nr:hypothetical protein DRE_07586 [Drechslerella stenobrocha 248]
MVRTQQPATRKRSRPSHREPTPDDDEEEQEQEEEEEEEEEEEDAPPVRRRRTTLTTHAPRRSRLSTGAGGQQDEDDETGLQARKRARRRKPTDGDDSDDGMAQAQDEDEEQEDAEAMKRGVNPVGRLVRLALAHEYQRKPIRRQDITEKVLGAQFKGDFKQIFDEAQAALQHVFGFSMAELPATTEKISLAQQRRQAAAEAQRGGAGDTTVKSAAAAAAAAKKKDAAGSKSWQLVSTLPEAYRIPLLLAPQLPDDQAVLGLASALVTMVYLSGRSIGENLLRRHLRKFGVEERILVEGNRESGRIDNILAKLVREGYLVKLKDDVVVGQEQTFTYVVGPRGKLEVGREGVLSYVSRVYSGVDGDAVDDGLERKVNRAIGKDEAGERQAGEQEGGGGGGGGGEEDGGAGAGGRGRGARGRGGAARGGRRGGGRATTRRDGSDSEGEAEDGDSD